MNLASNLLTLESRVVSDDEVPYLCSSWMRSAKKQHDPLGAGQVFFKVHNEIIPRFITNHNTRIAFFADVPDEIAGWVCSQRTPTGTLVVHYVYVRAIYRKVGVARFLIESLGHKPGERIISTAMVNPCSATQRMKCNIENNPYLFFQEAYKGKK